VRISWTPDRLRRIRFFGAAILFVSLCACASTSRFQLVADEVPPGKTIVGTGTVSGSDCPWFGIPSLEAAVRDALSKRPGATALKDVSMTLQNIPFGRCLLVEGTPVK
jgi:hypothetical protein